jgi:hypothetical protein
MDLYNLRHTFATMQEAVVKMQQEEEKLGMVQ